MFEAEIHGKLPEIADREDILTSTVFGLLKYVVDKEVIVKVLQHAKTCTGQNFSYNLKGYEPLFKFWPSLNEFGYPDIIIEFVHSNERKAVVCLEVKYESQKSGEGEYDQLKRYFLGMQKYYPDSDFLGIVYLTDEQSEKDIKDSLDELEKAIKERPTEKIFGLRWSQVTKAIEEQDKQSLSEHDRRILEDVSRYLRYKNFVEFEKFTYLTSVFDTMPDVFYKHEHDSFSSFSYQHIDFADNLNNKIIYG